MVAFNPDGTVKWTFKTKYWLNSSPSIDGNGVIYIGDESGYLYAINPDGTLKWELDLKKKIYYSSVAIGSNNTILLVQEEIFMHLKIAEHHHFLHHQKK